MRLAVVSTQTQILTFALVFLISRCGGENRHYAELYAKPGRMHAGFAQFAAFDQDAIDNKAAVGHGRLQMPVLAVGGDHSLGSTMAYIMRFAADNVREVVIPDSGHWLMEEQPKATVAAILEFLSKEGARGPQCRRDQSTST